VLALVAALARLISKRGKQPQLFSEWMGAGIRPPRAMKRSLPWEFSAITGA
jgi:hypothetical protein